MATNKNDDSGLPDDDRRGGDAQRRQPTASPEFKKYIDLMSRERKMGFDERVAAVSEVFGWLDRLRYLTSPSDREVTIYSPRFDKTVKAVTFSSNNYLGLANHPHIAERARKAIDDWGTGLAITPLLGGRTRLHVEAEQRIAALKGTEDAVLFSSGFAANLGIMTSLARGRDKDFIIADQNSHTSVQDGLRMSGAAHAFFAHNDVDDLASLLAEHRGRGKNVYVAVEGVYSMRGDLAPLDVIAPLCKQHGAILVIDEAHSSGVLGRRGHGAAEHFGIEGQIDLTMGTCSKALGAVGGFVAATKPIIDLIRSLSTSYVFSASLTPLQVACILGALDVLEKEPERVAALHRNVSQCVAQLKDIGIDVPTSSGIISVPVPKHLDVDQIRKSFFDRGLIIGVATWPAVGVGEELLRISMMATHTDDDVRALVRVMDEVVVHG